MSLRKRNALKVGAALSELEDHAAAELTPQDFLENAVVKIADDGKNQTEIQQANRKIHEIEFKGFRRIFSRFDKLDVMFTAFIHFAFIVEALR